MFFLTAQVGSSATVLRAPAGVAIAGPIGNIAGMGIQGWGLALEIVGMGCWIACFTWMYRLSARQEELLRSLHEQARKIAELSKAEHELIKEVHPQVGEIRDSMKEVAEAMAGDGSGNESDGARR